VNIYLGSQVPNFIAQDENGDNQEFYDLKDKKNLILVFFRGYW
jgi:peroxiredoxin